MKKSTLESLPNELLLIIFKYLSSFDLCQAFLDVQNVRIERLLTSLRHSLDVSSMHYSALCEFLTNSDNNTKNRFTDLINTVVLRGSNGCMMLFDYWDKRLNDSESWDVWLPSIQQLHILNPDCYKYTLAQSLLKPLIFHGTTLQHLHIVFKEPTYIYSSTLYELVLHDISIRTMIFEVEKGHKFYPDESIKNLHKVKPLCWTNTVQLTLSIQHSSELALLFRDDALPMIEHLEITNEEVLTALSSHQDKPILINQLCMDNFCRITNDIRLQSLVLRYISIGDLVILIDSLNMPLLEKLILIDLYDYTLDHVDKFKELCCSNRLPVLKHLYFSFCFPKKLEEEWKRNSFDLYNEWPFDNIDCYMDEGRLFIKDKFKFITQQLFIVYKRPINILLQYKRSLCNHYFTTHVSSTIKTSRQRSVVWECDQINEPDRVIKSLQVIASDHVYKLYVQNKVESTSVSMTTNLSTKIRCNLFLIHLRSLTFDFKLYSEKNIQRNFLLEQILDASPNLSHLVVPWRDFRRCKKTYSNLKHLHLMLQRLSPEPKHHVNINRLSRLSPNLRRLETNHANIMLNENLIEFILETIRRFHQLVYLTLNKHSLYPVKKEETMMFKERLIAAGNGQLFDINNIQMKFRIRAELRIWF